MLIERPRSDVTGIVCVGEATRDHFVDEAAVAVGGISLNFAVHARRQGAASVALVSAVGRDLAGAALRDLLIAERIDDSHVCDCDGATAMQVIRRGHGGERIFPAGGYDPGVIGSFTLSQADRAFIASFGVVVVPVFRQVEQLADDALTAARPGAVRVGDLLDGTDLGSSSRDWRHWTQRLDITFVSGPEERVEQVARLAAPQRILVVTHGAEGSTALHGQERVRQAACFVPPDECVDTTGCGDAFQAAFVLSYLRDASVPRALAAGAACAAGVVRHLGGVGGAVAA